MSWFSGIVSMFVEKLANRVADEVILFLRKKMRYANIDQEAKDLKTELKLAESHAEREAVLDKIHDLINDIGGV